MPKRLLDLNVYDGAVERMARLFRAGHRIVVSFSGGKDSTVALEVALQAARQENCLPLDVVMRDEEIMFPGTFEFSERVAARPEVSFHWIYANQPIINVYNRVEPFFWTFDPLLPPEAWVRRPPDSAYAISDKVIDRIVMPQRFPTPRDRKLINVMGLRVSESLNRRLGFFASGGYLTKPNEFGVYRCRPIYDWTDGDVWKAIRDFKWDYNSAYDVMAKFGISKSELRITPPTLTLKNSENLRIAAKAWPRWFDRVCRRLPGVRSVVLFGRRAASPDRHSDETWQAVFQRECIDEAPADWIAIRAEVVRDKMLRRHSRHSSQPFPESAPCFHCNQGAPNLGSWKMLAEAMYGGDPFCMRTKKLLAYVDPEFFRPDGGKWEKGGNPTF